LTSLVALLALPLSGCEIALIVAAAEDDGGDTYDYDQQYYDSYCNEYVDTTAGLAANSGKATIFTSTFAGVASPKPLTLLASNDLYPFFLDTTVTPDVDFRVDATGKLSRVDESVGACSTNHSTAASFLEVKSGEVGSGSLVVFVDGEQHDRFDFEIAAVESLELEWDPTRNAALAMLHDDEGRDVYAYSGITWEAAPTALFAVTAGPISPTISWDGTTKEVVLFAFYGDFTAQMTLVADEFSGLMSPKEE